MNDDILQPNKAYSDRYSKEIVENSEKMLEDLVAQSGVNVEENRATCKKLAEKQAESDAFKNKVANAKGWKGFLVFLMIVAVVVFVGFLYSLINDSCETATGVPATVISAIVFIVSLLVVQMEIKPLIGDVSKQIESLEKEIVSLKNKAVSQMAPLNALFDETLPKKLVMQTVPLIQLDENFNVKRLEYLCGKYGYHANVGKDRSTLQILSGEILGNPFVEERTLATYMGSQTYYGSIVITWTETHRDSEGRPYTVYRSETLTASVTKPKPFYYQTTTLTYCNEAAPNLNFSRKPGHIERLSESELERKVKRGQRKLEKKTRKELVDDDPTTNFTVMANEKFDVTFGATDRDNEQEFRLLFTPLAQQNVVSLLRSKPFGDDFDWTKRGCVNTLHSEHSASFELDTNPDKYRHYCYDEIKKKFVSFCSNYFTCLFFDLAPMLSVPLYQQIKSREYIYKHDYKNNYTLHEDEVIANKFGKGLAHPKSKTPAILKADCIQARGKSDVVNVTAYSYDTLDRVEYFNRLGGDGNMHVIPVHWLEYVPLVQNSVLSVREIGSGNDNADKVRKGFNGKGVFSNGLFASLTQDDNFDGQIDKLFKNNN